MPTHPHHNLLHQPHDSIRHRIANDPYLDWLIMVVVASVMSLVCIGVGLISYQSVRRQLGAPVDASAQQPRALFDRQSLDRALREFGARADEQSSLLKGYAGVADPSL